jgi:DNA helicase-2/ATP-dependent DNA helicase PcrA
VRQACDGLLALVDAEEKPTARAVLRYVSEANLFTVPDVLLPFASADVAGADGDIDEEEGEEANQKSELGGWRLALDAPVDQIEKYDRYVRGV